jgi:hypothetical protein
VVSLPRCCSYLVATSFDGSVPLLYAAMTVLECAADTGRVSAAHGCQRRSSVNYHGRLRQKRLRAANHAGKTSAIKRSERQQSAGPTRW